MWYINTDEVFQKSPDIHELIDVDNDGKYELIVIFGDRFVFLDPVTGNIKKYKKISTQLSKTNLTLQKTNPSLDPLLDSVYFGSSLFYNKLNINFLSNISEKMHTKSDYVVQYYYFCDTDCDGKKEIVFPFSGNYLDFDDGRIKPILPGDFAMDVYNLDKDPYAEVVWFSAKNATIKIFERRHDMIITEYQILLPNNLRRQFLGRLLVFDVDRDGYKELFFISHDYDCGTYYITNSVLFEVDLNSRNNPIIWSITLGNFSFVNSTTLYPCEIDDDANLELFIIVNKTLLIIDPKYGNIIRQINLIKLLPEYLKDVMFQQISRVFICDFDNDGYHEALLRYVIPFFKSKAVPKYLKVCTNYSLLIDINDNFTELFPYAGEPVFFGNSAHYIADVDNDSYYEILIFDPEIYDPRNWIFSLFKVIDLNNDTTYELIDSNKSLILVNSSKLCGFGLIGETTRLIDIDNDGHLETTFVWILITQEGNKIKENIFLCMIKLLHVGTLYDIITSSDTSAMPFIYYAIYDLDRDFDTLASTLEKQLGTSDLAFDTDNDGLGDPYEYYNGLDPMNADPDNDFLKDSVEISRKTNPLDADSDDDFVIDGLDMKPNDRSDGILWHGLMCTIELCMLIIIRKRKKNQ